MVQQNTNSASVLYTVQLNKVELGLFGGEATLLLVASWLVAKLPGGEMTGNLLEHCSLPPLFQRFMRRIKNSRM